jgi:signal transduction histidine kinase
MFDLLKTQECGWVEYMWPKPGEAIAAKKSTYVKKAKFGPDWFLVGSGVYLTANHGPTAAPPQLTSKELLKLTRCIATTFKKNGEESLPEIKKQCTGLEKNHAYVFILNSAGIKIFDSANPKEIGQKFTNIKDLNNRPVSRWIKEIVTSKSGEGWIHFFWPKPKEFYPIWTTVFAKRARAPNGKIYSIIGGVNNMPAEKRFLMDTANQAAYLVKGKGKAALPEIRAPGSRFTPLGICTFVSSADGTELLNTASPQLEGQNLLNYKDAAGKYPRQELLAVVQTKGNGWINYLWPKPGEATPSKIVVYARQVKHGEETFIVGASAYLENSTPARRKQK